MKDVQNTIAINPLADPSAFVERYQQGLWLWARILGGDEVSADDITQETLLKALQHAQKGKLETRSEGEMIAWLRTTAKHLFLTQKRKQHRREAILRADAAETIWSRLSGTKANGDQHWLDALRACLDKLETSDTRLAKIIRLHYSEGNRAEGIAEALQISPSNVYTLLHRARAVLRACVERSITDEQ